MDTIRKFQMQSYFHHTKPLSTANNVICHKVVGESWNTERKHIFGLEISSCWDGINVDKNIIFIKILS